MEKNFKDRTRERRTNTILLLAGWHTVENTGLNVGMGKHRDVNSYYYPSATRVTTGDWHFHNYDLDGSYMVPEVHAFHTYNSTGENVLPVLKPVTGREQYTVPGNPDHDGPGENRILKSLLRRDFGACGAMPPRATRNQPRPCLLITLSYYHVSCDFFYYTTLI